MTQYNFMESFKRIDDLQGFDLNNKALPYVPSTEEMANNSTMFVNATVMYIRINAENTSNDKSLKNFHTSIHSFLSELTCICRSNENCRDLIIMPKHVMVVYSTPKKVDVDTVIDDSARIRTLAMVINKKCKGIKITTSIGVDYGQVLMTYMKSESGVLSIVWNGNPIDKAFLLTEKENSGKVIITEMIWNNIRQEKQRLFNIESVFEEYYIGNIINVVMNNWILTNDK